MEDNSSILADATLRLFNERGNPIELRKAPGARKVLWNALEESGLTLAWVDESQNGAGASISEGFEVIRIAGGFAVDVPLVETLLAGWLLARAGLASPAGAMTLAPVDRRDRFTMKSRNQVSGAARLVPFAREAKHIVIVVDHGEKLSVAQVEAARCRILEKQNLAGDARDGIELEGLTPIAIADLPLKVEDILLMGAAVRAMQMAGAMQTILEMTVSYANERIAFEKPIGKFQAIQHGLAKLAAEAAAALAVAGSAADAIHSTSNFDEAVFLEAASAKIRIGEAVAASCAIAHQVHGAIGFSQEHPLPCYTQRLSAWRDDFGDESFWALRLGERVARNGADALWPMLAAR